MTRSPFSLKNNAYKLCTPNKKPQPPKYFLKHKFYSLLENYETENTTGAFLSLWYLHGIQTTAICTWHGHQEVIGFECMAFWIGMVKKIQSQVFRETLNPWYYSSQSKYHLSRWSLLRHFATTVVFPSIWGCRRQYCTPINAHASSPGYLHQTVFWGKALFVVPLHEWWSVAFS